MFALNEKGETASIIIKDFKPFFYVKVPNHWKKHDKLQFIEQLKNHLGDYQKDNIISYNFEPS